MSFSKTVYQFTSESKKISEIAMKYIKLKNMNMSQIILGTDGYSERINKETAYELLDFYIGHGGNVIDTARMYCSGESEKLIGEYLKNRRDKVYISTKCSHPPLDNMSHSRLSREDIESDIDESLNALNTDYIDILWLHRDDESKPVAPIIDALNEMISKGKIRHFGASNWTYKRIAEANAYADSAGLEGFCASQILYNMATCSRVWDDTLVVLEGKEKEAYDNSHFPVFAFCSQAKGFFEKYATGNLSEKSKDRYYNEKSVDTFGIIQKTAVENGDTISYTALDMLDKQSDFDVFPIIGPSNINQLKSTLNIK